MGNLTSLVELMQTLLTRLAKARVAIISPILREESSPDSIIFFRNLMEELEPEVKAISKKSCLAVSLSSSSNLRPLSSSNTLCNSSSFNRKRDLERVRTWADTCFFSNSSTSLRSLTIWEIFSTIFCFRVEGDSFFRGLTSILKEAGRIFREEGFRSPGRGNFGKGRVSRPLLNNLQSLFSASDNIFSVISLQVLENLSLIQNNLQLNIFSRAATSKVSGHGRPLRHKVAVAHFTFHLIRDNRHPGGTLGALGNISGLGDLVGLQAPLLTSFHAHLAISQLGQHVGGDFNELVSVFTLSINSLLHDTPDFGQTASFSSHIVLADVNSARRGLDLDEGDEGLLKVEGPGGLLTGRLDLLDFTFNHGKLNRRLQHSLVLRGSLFGLRGMHEPPVFRLKTSQLLVELGKSHIFERQLEGAGVQGLQDNLAGHGEAGKVGVQLGDAGHDSSLVVKLEFMAGGEEGLGSHGSEDEGDESKGSHDESRSKHDT